MHQSGIIGDDGLCTRKEIDRFIQRRFPAQVFADISAGRVNRFADGLVFCRANEPYAVTALAQGLRELAEMGFRPAFGGAIFCARAQRDDRLLR